MPLFKFSNLNKYKNIRTRIIFHPTSNIGINPKGYGSFIMVHLFKYEYVHPVIGPTLYVDPLNQKWIVPTYQKVHPKTTLEDIEWIKPPIEKVKTETKTWNISSSDNSKEYLVKKIEERFSCSCWGFLVLKDKNLGCKHIKQIKNGIK